MTSLPANTHSNDDGLEEAISVANGRLKVAIRWLAEARRFKSDFGCETWKSGPEGEISNVATTTYDEAIASVIVARKRLDSLIEKSGDR